MRIMRAANCLTGGLTSGILFILCFGVGSLWAEEYPSAWVAVENLQSATDSQNTPSASSGSSSIDDFFAIEDSLEDLPAVLDENGIPVGDAPPLIEEPEVSQDGGEGVTPWIERGGYLEYRGSYSTNIDLSAPGIDFDLRRKHAPNNIAIRETEVSDWINGIELGYNYEIPILPEVMKAAVRYHLEQDDFMDEKREDRTQQTFELATIQRLTETIEWEIYGGYEYENRHDDAQYLTPDYNQYYFGTEARQTIGDNASLELGYEFRKRDYEKVTGGVAPDDTPWEDWEQHRIWMRYDRDLCPTVTLNLGMALELRDHESPALTDIGDEIDGTYRQYDLLEPRAGLTFHPSDRDWIRVYYRLRSLNSTGDYYDYDQNSVTIQYTREVCPGLIFRSEFEYANRDYAHQAAYKNNAAAGTTTRRNEVREDDRISLYFAVERTVADVWTTGVDFTYLDNDSNDDSSRYQEDRYGVYVRREF